MIRPVSGALHGAAMKTLTGGSLATEAGMSLKTKAVARCGPNNELGRPSEGHLKVDCTTGTGYLSARPGRRNRDRESDERSRNVVEKTSGCEIVVPSMN